MNSLKRSLRESYPEAWRWISLSRHIPGWLTDGEANSLFEIARSRVNQPDPVIVELGSWQGKSSVLLAAGLCGALNARVFCVDPFESDENPRYQSDYYDPLVAKMRHSLKEGFDRNIRRCGVAGIVHTREGYSYEVAQGWKDPIDVLFIDANHEYACVHRDFMLWSPFVKSGGIIALHDVSPSWPGPSRVMAEELQPPEYGDLRQIDSLAWAVKQSDKPSSRALESARTLITIPYVDYAARLREIERLTNAVSLFEAKRNHFNQRAGIDSQRQNGVGPGAMAEETAGSRVSDQEVRVAQLERDLRSRESELRRAVNELAESRGAVESLRRSWSWRLTSPVRAVADAARSISGLLRFSGRGSARH